MIAKLGDCRTGALRLRGKVLCGLEHGLSPELSSIALRAAGGSDSYFSRDIMNMLGVLPIGTSTW